MKTTRNTWYDFLLCGREMDIRQLTKVFLWIVVYVSAKDFKKDKMLSRVCKQNSLLPHCVSDRQLLLAYKKSCKIGTSAGIMDLTWIQNYFVSPEILVEAYSLVFLDLLKKGVSHKKEIESFKLLAVEPQCEIVDKFLANTYFGKDYSFCLWLCKKFKNDKYEPFYDILTNYCTLNGDIYNRWLQKIINQAIGVGRLTLTKQLVEFYFPHDKNLLKEIDRVGKLSEEYKIPIRFG